ncbi:MAG: Mini-ribonuclease 3 [Leptolyngbyaceae cyanobacterium]
MTQHSPEDELKLPNSGFNNFVVGRHSAVDSRLSPDDLRKLSPLALAYIGDAVYELFVRSRLLLPPRRAGAFHQQVVQHVRAEQQAQYLEILIPHLLAVELDLLRRARNAASGRKVRASLQDYRQATAFEALLGYLYLADSQRLLEVLSHLPITDQSPLAVRPE